MSRVCQITKKRPMSGHHVSHSKIKKKRRFLPNLHWHRFWLPSQKRFVRLLVSAQAMRTIDKQGIEAVLKKLEAKGELNHG